MQTLLLALLIGTANGATVTLDEVASAQKIDTISPVSLNGKHFVTHRDEYNENDEAVSVYASAICRAFGYIRLVGYIKEKCKEGEDLYSFAPYFTAAAVMEKVQSCTSGPGYYSQRFASVTCAK